MTKNIIHAIKKFLRIGVVAAVTISGTINASAQGNIPGLCSASCNSQLNASLDASGYVLIDPTMAWDNIYNGVCFPLLDQVEIEIAGSTPVSLNITQNGHTVNTISARLDCSFIGQNVEYNLVQYYSNGTVNSCWGNVLIEDKMKPIIDCSDLTIKCTEDIDPYQLVDIYNNAIPVALDNCDVPILTFQDSEEDYNCLNPDFLKKITRVWTATDESGNQQTCTQNIFIEKASGAVIQFPAHLNNINAPALTCPNANVTPENTGYPTLYGVNIGDADLCNFSSYYEDQTINTCGGSFKILRNWTVVDWCTNEIFTSPQIIKVLDEVAPSLTCPIIPDVGTTSNSCTGNLILPEAIISDACSGFTVTTETPLGVINGNGGLVIGLELGTHTITYVAEDECGNVNSCSTTVTIIDNIAPSVICDEHTTVSLSNNGIANVSAAIFDDGSTDNCEIANYEVRRMDNPNCSGNGASAFGEYVAFTCCDIGSIVMVELRVTDVAGNFNSCMIEVEVQDKLDPVIICPPSVTLQCQEDYTNTTLTGEAIATDNCPGVVMTFNDISIDINQCGVGDVTRVWTATDAQGRTTSCIQKIYLINDNPFEESDIIFPLDFDTDICGGGDLSTENLPSLYSEPIINGDVCDLVGVDYEDQILQIASPACYKILRKWTVIDWCTFDPNYSGGGQTPGEWTHVQVIKVTDNEAPEFTICPSDQTIKNFASDCGGTFVSLQVEATDCSNEIAYTYEIDYHNDGTIDASGIGNDASGAFQNGMYKIIFAATDGCGNTNYCSFDFTIEDGKKPTPVCINGLSADLMTSTGTVQIWASDFESGSSFDNCTDYEDLKFSFSSDINDTYREFNCDSLGIRVVEFWVTDLAGNQDFCSTTIDIQDNNGICPTPNATAIIAGNIQNEMGEEIENVTIEIAGGNILPMVTGANGNFISPNLPAGQTYTVAPKKDMNHLNGVSTYDLVLISKHILGTELLNSPYKIIAADANKSESITTLDIIQLRKMILHIDDELQYNTSWRFVAADFVFSDPLNPFVDDFPEVTDIENLANDEATDFIGIKIGDVNNTAIPNNFLETSSRNDEGVLQLEVEDAQVKKGELVQVDFKAKDFKDVLGFQFTLKFDQEKMNFEEVKSNLEGLTHHNFGFTFLAEGMITISWDNTPSTTLEDETILFSLILRGVQKTNLVDAIQVSSTMISAEAYVENDSAIELKTVELFFNGFSNNTTWNKLHQNQPNPATTFTTIPFELVLSQSVVLKVIDVHGRIVKVIRGDFEKGYNEIQLTNLEGNGIFYYQLEMSKGTLIKKMILVNK